MRIRALRIGSAAQGKITAADALQVLPGLLPLVTPGWAITLMPEVVTGDQARKACKTWRKSSVENVVGEGPAGQAIFHATLWRK